jgi:uncharacterized membrane protein YheB (UPF0754 family)
MSNNPGFDILKEAFKKFASKYDGADLAARGVRIAATGGKAIVDSTLNEFPKTFVNQAAKDIYALLTSQEIADGVSASVRAFDEEKVKEIIDGIVSQMKDPETALKIAKQVKNLLDKAPVGDLEAQIDGLLSMNDVPMANRMIFMAVFSQIKPILEDMKNSSDEEVANKLMELADMIPSDAIAAQVANLTREVTPEKVSKQAHDLVGKFPSSQTVADIIHGVGNLASEKLDSLSKVASASEAPAILKDLLSNAGDIVKDAVAKDKAAKKTFDKKGGKFDL